VAVAIRAIDSGLDFPIGFYRLEPEDTYRVALVRAAELLGGAVTLSRRLQVPMPDLTRWLAGYEKPSIGTFLKVVDIIIEEGRKTRLSPAANDQPEQAQKQAD
jgi:hypothetical protein